MYANTGTDYIPSAKTWNKMGTRTVDVSTVATTKFPSVNIGTSVHRLVDFLQSMLSPFSFQKNQSRLKTQLESFTDSDSALANDISLMFDLLTQSQLLPSETEDTKLGFSILKSLKLNSCTACTFEGIPPNLLGSMNCGLVFNPSKGNSSLSHNLQRCMIPSETNIERTLIIKNLHMTENMHKIKSQVLKNSQEKALCLYQPINYDNQTCTVNMQAVISVLPEAASSNTTAPKVKDNNVSILNQELVIRKSKKMTKVSRKRRRRQKKKTEKNKPTFSCNPPDQHLDDFQIIFNKPESPKTSRTSLNDSFSSDDFCIEFSYGETGIKPQINHALSIVSESRFDVQSGGDLDLNESSDFCIEFSYEETEVDLFNDAQSIISRARLSSESGDSNLNESSDFCIEFDEVDCSFIKPTFTFESEDDSDLNNSYDTVEFGDLDFSVETYFVSGLSSVCTALASSSISDRTVCCDENDVLEMSEELKMINEQWEKDILNVPSNVKSSRAVTKKVSFACDQDLVSIFSVEIYERKGEWETYALERFRFKRRIEDLEEILSPCLSASHRNNVWLRLQSNSV